MDEILSPLLPLFHCKSYSTPFRILNEEEVAALSGLYGVWARISPQDAEALPEKLVRDYCGNCFHPALISSALGNNEVRRWATGVHEGPGVLVASQSEAFQVFAHLCDQVWSMMIIPVTVASSVFYFLKECLVPHGGLRLRRGVSPGVLTALRNAAPHVDYMSSISVWAVSML